MGVNIQGQVQIDLIQLETLYKSVAPADPNPLLPAKKPSKQNKQTQRGNILTTAMILSQRPDGRMPLQVLFESMDRWLDIEAHLLHSATTTPDPLMRKTLMESAHEARAKVDRLAQILAPFCHPKFAQVNIDIESDETPTKEYHITFAGMNPSQVVAAVEGQKAAFNRKASKPTPFPYESTPKEAEKALERLNAEGLEPTRENLDSVVP